MKFRNDIQGLRAIAVLFVFIFHLSKDFLPGGFIGVDVFFVISGYLISKIILSKIDKNNFSLKDFYISRLKRIVPAYYFLLIVVWIGFFFIFLNADIGKFKLSHFWATLFNSNYYFSNVDNYFGASSTENPLLHTWTLGIEMQFYFFLPLLLLIRNKRLLNVVLIILTASLFTYGTYEIIYNQNKSAMYFSLLARTPEFLVGVLFAVFHVEKKTFVVNNSLLLSVFGLLGLLASVILFQETSAFPGVSSLIPCLSTAILLVTPASNVNRFLSNKVLSYIGEISYSVYLWHWPIMAFIRYYYGKYEFSPAEMIVVTLLTILSSLASYYLIERRLRREKSWKFYAPLGIMLALNVAMIYFVTPLKFAYSAIPLEYIYPGFARESHSNTFQKVGFYGEKNYDGKRILLLGDSHALSFVPYLEEYGKKEGVGFRVLTNDSYPSIPGLDENVIHEKMRLDIYKKLLPHITDEIQKADIIILFFTGSGTSYISALSEMFDNLKEKQKVLVLQDYPTLDVNPVRINRDFIKNEERSYKYKIHRSLLDRNIIKMIEKNDKIKFVDFSDHDNFFNDAPFYNDTLMYYDGNHLNYYGATRYEQASRNTFKVYLDWAIK